MPGRSGRATVRSGPPRSSLVPGAPISRAWDSIPSVREQEQIAEAQQRRAATLSAAERRAELVVGGGFVLGRRPSPRAVPADGRVLAPASRGCLHGRARARPARRVRPRQRLHGAEPAGVRPAAVHPAAGARAARRRRRARAPPTCPTSCAASCSRCACCASSAAPGSRSGRPPSWPRAGAPAPADGGAARARRRARRPARAATSARRPSCEAAPARRDLREQLREAWVYAIDLALTPVGLARRLARRRDAVGGARDRAAARRPRHLRPRARAAASRASLELNNAYRGTALVLGDVVEADDGYTGEHCRGVVALALDVGGGSGSTRTALRNLEFGALLHDVGKVAIPKEIINKPGHARPGRVGDHQDAHDRGPAHARSRRRLHERRRRGSSAPTTSAGTAAATPTGWPARRSRSRRASSPAATPGTR